MQALNNISLIILGIIALYIIYQFIRSIRMVPTQTALVVERLGKFHSTLDPGFHILIPFFDRVAFQLDLREEAIAVEPQECFTMDNVKVEVDGVIYISIVDARHASYGITDYRYAAIQLAQTTTRAVIGTIELDKTFEEREMISARVVSVLGEVAEAWGIRVHRYEVKNIVPPPSVRDAMEKQMTAERNRRAMIATAEGKRQALINDSEGIKTEMVNLSEGEKQKQINEAEGRAQEIESIARATAASIRKMAQAISSEHGEEAIRMRLSQSHLNNLKKLASSKKEIILPLNLTSFDEVLKGIDLSTFPQRLNK
jgi:regulator of protease activity HflC (stomatin/prohibitin superfamily)